MEQPLENNLLEQLKKLQEKYGVMGQDLSSYLDGLLYSDYLTYWDYIHLDTLLSLQTTKTHFPDEKVFITYHQITELYFSLILFEIEQAALAKPTMVEFFKERLTRIIRYFKHLTDSFEIMTDGMEREQFLKFRMALLPASGFQSAQYRLIELGSTDLINLVDTSERKNVSAGDSEELLLEKLYWRNGAVELSSKKKTLTLEQFETKYMHLFQRRLRVFRDTNLLQIYVRNFEGNKQIIEQMREVDVWANVKWSLAHMKSASRYLHRDDQDIKASGGTNWQRFLPPNFQKIMFFPQLWSDTEKEEWGRVAFEE